MSSLFSRIAGVMGNFLVGPSGQGVITAGNGAASFVFRPGGTAAGNVYTTFPALYAALNVACPVSASGTRPPSMIRIDDTLISPAVIPAGAYNFDGVDFRAVASDVTDTGGAALNLAVGVRIASPCTIHFDDALFITYLDTASPCITPADGQEVNLFFDHGASIGNVNSAGPFVQTTDGSFALITANDGSLFGYTNNTTTFVDDGTGGSISLNLFNLSILRNGNITGAGSRVLYDSSSVPLNPQGNATLIPVSYIVPLGYTANSSLTTAVQQAVPLGNALVTSSSDLIPGQLCTTYGTISSLYVRHTGSAANVAGQTITYEVFKNGNPVTGSPIAGVASTAGNQAANVTFTPVPFDPGDILTVQLLPSAPLTAALTNVMCAVS